MDGSIGAQEAMTQLFALLDRVAQGESVTITRDGTPVARLVPVVDAATSPVAVTAAFQAHRDALRAGGVVPFTVDEVLELRDAGRRG